MPEIGVICSSNYVPLPVAATSGILLQPIKHNGMSPTEVNATTKEIKAL